MSLSNALRIASLLLVPLAAGCSSTGIRALSEQEQDYFTKLRAELTRSTDEMQSIFDDLADTEKDALSEISEFHAGLTSRRVVGSASEALISNEAGGESAALGARAKALTAAFAEAAAAREKSTSAEHQLVDERRDAILAGFEQLGVLAGEAQDSGKLIYNFLGRDVSVQVMEVISEARRQITGFRETVAKGDRENPVVRDLMEVSEKAEKVAEDADKKAEKLVDMWSHLSSKLSTKKE